MQTIDMFPAKYLKGEQIKGRPVLARLREVVEEKLRSGPDKPAEPAYVLYFVSIKDPTTGEIAPVRGLALHQKGHALVLRRDLADEIMRATNTTDTDQWPSKIVVFFAGEPKKTAGRTSTPLHARAVKVSQQAQPQTNPESQPQTEGAPA